VQLGIEVKNFSSNQRNDFNRDICTLISTRTLYPREAERQLIAQKIVGKFPFLKDPILGENSTEWVSEILSSRKQILKYQMVYLMCMFDF
jgi:hypothetical protein